MIYKYLSFCILFIVFSAPFFILFITFSVPFFILFIVFSIPFFTSFAVFCPEFSIVFIPFFKFQFPDNLRTYILLGISCIFYAIADRVNTTARRGLEVSVYSILGQLSTVFVIAWGIIFFKEAIVIKKIIGALLIIFGNIAVLYKKGKFVLKADNKEVKDINVSNSDKFQIIGKIYI